MEDTHIWGRDETLLLINLYSQYKEEFHNGKCTVKQYWEKIANIMKEKGYNIMGLKCSTKFQSLKRTYKTIVDHNKKSGNNTRKWDYFEIMQELFGDKPWVQPVVVAGSHIINMDENEDEDEEKNPPNKCIKKRKRNTSLETLLADMKEERKRKADIREKQQEEKMRAFKRMENFLQK